MSRTTFQTGSLYRVPNREGHRWVLRFNKDGQRKAVTIGNDITLPSLNDARRKAAQIMPGVNDNNTVYTFGELAAKYETDELGLIKDATLRAQTISSYRSNLKHISEKWENVPLDAMLKDLMAIQAWLRDLKTFPTEDRTTRGKAIKGRPARPLAKKSKQAVKALLHRLVNCAMKWGYLPVQANPIGLVEVKVIGIQPKKRLKIPLTVTQFFKLMNDPNLSEHVKVMAKLSMFLGLRISEVLGLRWEAIDLEGCTINIELSSVGKHINDTKSVESNTVLPLHDYLVLSLQQWKEKSVSTKGWVFESFVTDRPFHRDALQADHLAPAGDRNGIPGLGWHTFRHSHAKLLRVYKVASEVQMMLMRHADMKTTNDYGRDDGSLDLKREANTTLIDAILKEKG